MNSPNANTISKQIFKMASLHPDQICMQDAQKSLTYSQLVEKIDAMGELLKSKGAVPGDRLVIPIENTVDSVVAFLGILKCSGTAVLLDPRLPSKDLHQLILASDPVAVLALKTTMEKLDPQLIPNLPVLDIQDQLAPNSKFSTQVSCPKEPDREPDVAVILYTSGTSGDYKGVMITHENLITAEKSCLIMGEGIKIWYAVLPIYHIYPLICAVLHSLVNGRCLRFLALENIFQIFQTKEPWAIVSVPRLLEFMLAKIKSDPAVQSLIQKLDKDNMKVVCGGAPLSERVQRACQELGIPIFCGYGLSEGTGVISFSYFGKKQVIGSVGTVVPGIEVRFDLPDKTGVGEICIRGAQVMKGYFRSPQTTAEALRDGWFHTGDLGYLDSDGYLFITGRIKDVIVLPTGEKSMPENIESQYAGIKGIKELAIVGKPAQGQHWDEIHAVVIPEKKDATLEEIEALIQEKGRQLPFHLQIQKVHLAAEIPKTSTGKARRGAIRDLIQNESEQRAPVVITNEPIYLLLREWLAKIIGGKQAEVDENKPFTYYGIDSLSIWQLCEKLNEEYQMNITPLTVMEYPSIKQLAEYCKSNQGSGSKIPPIFYADRSKELPLSLAEEIHWQRAQSPWQNYLYGVDLTGPLNPEYLKKSFAALFERYEILRTAYHQKGDRLYREISPIPYKSKEDFRSFDLSSSDEKKVEFHKIVNSYREKSIPFNTLPLVHIALIKFSTTRHCLILLLARPIVDGISIALLIEEAGALYKSQIEGKPLHFSEPLKYQYADYANWQRSLYDQGVFAEEETFWKNQFERMELVSLPGKKANLKKEQQIAKDNLVPGVIPVGLSASICKELSTLSMQSHSYLPTLLSSVFQIALHCHTKKPRITIRELNADRKKSYLKRMIGYLNTGLGIIADFNEDRKFKDFLLAHQKQLHLAMLNADIYFEGVVGKWGSLIKGEPPYSLNVSYNFLSFPMPAQFGDLKISMAELDLEEYLYPPGLELDFVLTHTPDGGVAGGMYYRKVLFDEASIAPIAQYFIKIATLIAEKPEPLISEIVNNVIC